MSIKLTPEEFITKVKKRHGDKYSFEKTNYINMRTKVIVTCNIHSYDFTVFPDAISTDKKKNKNRNILGSCPICHKEYFDNIRFAFIEKMRIAHNYEYDYDVDNYVNVKTRFNAICKKHGTFSIYPSNHVLGIGKCPFCELEKETIKTINDIRYCYCEIHGRFPVGKHITKSDGCPKCKKEKLEIEKFNIYKQKINEKFGEIYDVFITEKYVELRCKKHGTRETILRENLKFSDKSKKHYCSKCLDDKKLLFKQELETRCKQSIVETYSHLYAFIELLDKDDYGNYKIRLANLIHGGEKTFGAYSIIKKEVSTEKAFKTIIHISFDEAKALVRKLDITSFRQYKKWHKRTNQTSLPSNPHRSYKEWISHYDFFGTDAVKDMSTGEQRIKNYFERKKLDYVYQKKYDDCRNINPLPFDFYLPVYNLIVEFDGYQHYGEVNIFGDFETTQKHDGIKNKYCEDNDINILRIPYWELENNTVEWTLDNEITRIAAELAIQDL